MEILHIISNRDNSGGTIAAINLHETLLNLGYKSSVLSSDLLSGYLTGNGYRKFGGFTGHVQQAFLSLEDLIACPSFLNPIDKFILQKSIRQFKGIVHIHITHVAQISFELLNWICKGNKVFWTLHDLWPLTAKCIHPIDCIKYLKTCHSCPKLTEYPKLNWDNTPFLHQQKQNFIKKHQIHFVSPSSWITNETMNYIGNLNGNISTIQHAINTSIFKPNNKTLLRKKYNLPTDGDLVLFPQGRWDDIKKGGSWYLAIKNYLEQSTTLTHKIYLIRLIGDEVNIIKRNTLITEINLPTTIHKEVMSDYYNLSDVTISISEIETFGLCVSESLACSKPVIARRAKGVTELLIDEVLKDTPEELANFILDQKWLTIDYESLFSHVKVDLTMLSWAKKHMEIYDL